MTSISSSGAVEFRFYRPAANEVSIVGDFKGWDRPIRMSPDGHGWWLAHVAVPPGEYRFRYLADGVEYADFASHGLERTENGWDSVLYVRERKVEIQQEFTLQVA